MARPGNPPISRKTIVASGLCIGCGACVTGTGEEGMSWDRYGQLRPSGPRAWLGQPDLSFERTCPFSPIARDEDQIAAALYPNAVNVDPLVGRYDAAYVGHVAEDDFRAVGTSGGMVSWVAAELLRTGLVDGVAHVVPRRRDDGERLFAYRISRDAAELRRGAKSRYYPVELSSVLAEMRSVPGRYAVVGVPCFIKAVNLLRAEDPIIGDRVAFTLGLVCGHMKSARMVESFAWQMAAAPEQIEAVEFRLKNPDRPANWYTAQLTLADGSVRSRDWWHLVDGDWGAGYFQYAACNFCDDVVAETADVSVGDAWVEPYSSDGRGTNVVIVRAPVIHDLICAGMADGRLQLAAVDRDFVVQTQAAGFRQRREGLAYRLARARLAVQPKKRVAPDASGLRPRRKLIYRARGAITGWSHRIFHLARRLRCPRLYMLWAEAAAFLYHGVAYSRGRYGRLVERYLPSGRES